ncbi:unnamed protein product [Choristocarpus tenellus]
MNSFLPCQDRDLRSRSRIDCHRDAIPNGPVRNGLHGRGFSNLPQSEPQEQRGECPTLPSKNKRIKLIDARFRDKFSDKSCDDNVSSGSASTTGNHEGSSLWPGARSPSDVIRNDIRDTSPTHLRSLGSQEKVGRTMPTSVSLQTSSEILMQRELPQPRLPSPPDILQEGQHTSRSALEECTAEDDQSVDMEKLRRPKCGETTCSAIHAAQNNGPSGLKCALNAACWFFKTVTTQVVAIEANSLPSVFKEVPKLREVCLKWASVPFCLAMGFGNMNHFEVGTVLEAFARGYNTPSLGDAYKEGTYVKGVTVVNYVGSLLTYRANEFLACNDLTDAEIESAHKGKMWKTKSASHPPLYRVWEALDARVEQREQKEGLARDKAQWKAHSISINEFNMVKERTDQCMVEARRDDDPYRYAKHAIAGAAQEILHLGGCRAMSDLANIKFSDFKVQEDGSYFYRNRFGEEFCELTPTYHMKHPPEQGIYRRGYPREPQPRNIASRRFKELFLLLKAHRPHNAQDRFFLQPSRDRNITFMADSPPWFTTQPVGRNSEYIKCIVGYARDLGLSNHLTNTSIRSLVQMQLALANVPMTVITIVVGHMSGKKGSVHPSAERRLGATAKNMVLYVEGMRSQPVRELVAVILDGRGTWDSLKGDKRIMGSEAIDSTGTAGISTNPSPSAYSTAMGVPSCTASVSPQPHWPQNLRVAHHSMPQLSNLTNYDPGIPPSVSQPYCVPYARMTRLPPGVFGTPYSYGPATSASQSSPIVAPENWLQIASSSNPDQLVGSFPQSPGWHGAEAGPSSVRPGRALSPPYAMRSVASQYRGGGVASTPRLASIQTPPKAPGLDRVEAGGVDQAPSCGGCGTPFFSFPNVYFCMVCGRKR